MAKSLYRKSRWLNGKQAWICRLCSGVLYSEEALDKHLLIGLNELGGYCPEINKAYQLVIELKPVNYTNI